MPGSNYDWKITAKKFFTGLFITVAPVSILYAIDFCESQSFPAEYLWVVPFIVALLHAALNAIKHWND